MATECRLPLLRQRAPGLPPVPVKLDRPCGGLAERGNAASTRVTAVADRPAVVQRLPAGLGKRDLGIRPVAVRMDPEIQAPPAAPVPIDAAATDCAASGCL